MSIAAGQTVLLNTVLPAGYRYGLVIWHTSSVNTVYGTGYTTPSDPTRTDEDLYCLPPVSTQPGMPKRSDQWIDGVHAQQDLRFSCAAAQDIYVQLTT